MKGWTVLGHVVILLLWKLITILNDLNNNCGQPELPAMYPFLVKFKMNLIMFISIYRWTSPFTFQTLVRKKSFFYICGTTAWKYSVHYDFCPLYKGYTVYKYEQIYMERIPRVSNYTMAWTSHTSLTLTNLCTISHLSEAKFF